jgi:S-adenosylmethionine:diacylglycerol 3-amino-3-carboxypropyl transferase
MPIVKKRNQQTETRLLLESDGPVELPPAAVEDGAVLVQFDKLKVFTPELLEVLRAGTTAEPVPVMLDGSTFMVHGQTRTFWIKIWHTAQSEMTRIERVQVISCLPSTRGLQIVVETHEDEEREEPDEDYTDS